MKKISILFAFTIFVFSASAQPGAMDTAFNNNLGYLFNPSLVYPVVLQPDGKIIIGGAFSVNNSYGILARLNSDGTIDPDFTLDSNYNYSLNCIALQSDGKIITGTTISNYQSRVMRLDGNGFGDFTFSAITLQGYYAANAIALQPDGKIVVGGDDSVSRFNANGSDDATFNFNANLDISVVQSIIIQPDKKILLIGDGIARLDSVGNLDSAFNPVLPFECLAAALLPDTQIIVAGLGGIVRLNSNGSVDHTFNASGLLFPGGYIQSLALEPDGKIIAAGVFVTTGNRSNIVRLNTDGSLDPTFNAGPGFGLLVNALAVQPDSNILVGGANYCEVCIPPHALARLYGGSPPLTATISGRDTICLGDTTLLVATSITDNGSVTYNWESAIGLSCDSCDSVKIYPDTTTTYTLIAQDNTYIDTVYFTVYVDSSHTPLVPFVSIDVLYSGDHNGVDFCTNTADSLAFEAFAFNGGSHPTYQWQINGQDIGITTDTFQVLLDSTVIDPEQCTNCVLTCLMTSSIGCVLPATVTSDSVVLVICEGINSPTLDNDVQVSPNPNNGTFVLSIDQPSHQLNIELLNLEGESLYLEQLKDVPSLNKELNFNYLAKGVYLLKITTENGIAVKRIVFE